MTKKPLELWRIKQHDTAPALEADLTDRDPTDPTGQARIPVDLTTATQIRVIAADDATRAVLFSRTITGNDLGHVELNWQTGDTNTAWQIMDIEFEVTTPDGKIRTYPPDDYIRVYVVGDLG